VSSKGGGTQGYRYLLSLFSGLGRGPMDSLIEIEVGDRTAWSGEAKPGQTYRINKPDLFGGDDKEGGIDGNFRVFMGDREQVMPGDIAGSIGGDVPGFRGVMSVWYDGMVSAMTPYLKPWKFRVRRTVTGWYNDVVWQKRLCAIPMGNGLGESGLFPVTTNRPTAFTVTAAGKRIKITFSRNPAEGDQLTINGRKLDYVADQKDKDLEYGQVDPHGNLSGTMKKTANYINANSTAYKATATYNNNSITLDYITGSAAAEIVGMNGAHILYQCFTDPLWGRGYKIDQLDEEVWVCAAQQLFNEGFGLALAWYRKEDLDAFMQRILDLIAGVLYTDRETGKIGLKLIRFDYIADELPVFTPSTGLLGISDDDTASSDNSYNEIIGTSHDPITNMSFQVRAQNLAGLQSQGAPASSDRDYKGIPTRDLLARVVLRDMRTMAVGLKKYVLTLDRSAWWLKPGDVIRVSDARRGLDNVVLRLVDIDDGNMLEGAIRIKATIDVFGMPETSFVEPVSSGWVGPSTVAAPARDQDSVEASYRDLYLQRGADFVNALDPDETYVGTLASAPNATSLQYDLLTKAEGDAGYREVGRADFTGRLSLVDAVGFDDTAWKVAKPSAFSAENVGQVLRIGGELVQITAWDAATGDATVKRGVADTVPTQHASGETLLTIDDDLKLDDRAYAVGETVTALVLTRTSQERLDVADADPLVRKLIGRHARPYPPADVRVDGAPFFSVGGSHPEPVITWSTRNRLTQADQPVGYFEPSIAPEAGQTVTIRVMSLDGMLTYREVRGLDAGTWAYTEAMQDEDSPENQVLMEIESDRGGLTSRTVTRFLVPLAGGWGYGWGTSWGG